MVGGVNFSNIPREVIDNEINKLGFEDNNSILLSSNADLNEIIKSGKYHYNNSTENNIKNLPDIESLNIFTLNVYSMGLVENKTYIIQEIIDYNSSNRIIRKIILGDENIFGDWQITADFKYVQQSIKKINDIIGTDDITNLADTLTGAILELSLQKADSKEVEQNINEINETIENLASVVPSTTEPENKKSLWIDLNNGGVAKYYNTSTNTWDTIAASWS